MSGRMIQQGRTLNSGNQSMHLQELSEGIYLLQLIKGQFIAQERIIIR